MKYCIVIMDGASGLPLPSHSGKTTLELARTPNLDAMALEGQVGLSRNVPAGMEPDSAVACMSIFGYDPTVYYSGRAPVEAVSMEIPLGPGEVVFRCNLVTVRDGKMISHSAGYITTAEAHELFAALNGSLAGDLVRIFPGVSYRSILKVKDEPETARAVCTPPHDIPGRPVKEYLPHGRGSKALLNLMTRSEDLLKNHPVNLKRLERGELAATGIWLFWGSGKAIPMPPFREKYGITAAVTSAVDLLQGLGKMASMTILNIPGVTDGQDNDYPAQATGALDALKRYDIVILHIESPDEAGHSGATEQKIRAIEKIDDAVIGAVRFWRGELRVLVTPDHPTPIITRTHNGDPVPFLLWGPGIKPNGAHRLTEADARQTGLTVDPGWKLMGRLLGA